MYRMLSKSKRPTVVIDFCHATLNILKVYLRGPLHQKGQNILISVSINVTVKLLQAVYITTP